MDGVGEWATTSAAMGSGNNLEVFQEIHFPHSLGLLYSAFTYYTGFKVNSGEYKLMGLAPYGEPKYAKLILDNLIDLKPDGSFRLDLSYFDYCTGLTMTNERFAALFGQPVRPRTSRSPASTWISRPPSRRSPDEAVLRLTPQPRQEDRCEEPVPGGRRGAQLRRQRQGAARRPVREHLDSAGGGRCRRRAGRRACAVHIFKDQPRKTNGVDGMSGSFLGPSFSQADDRTAAQAVGRAFHGAERRRDDRDDRSGSRRRAGGRLVPGPHGVRSARARRALDPRRSALTNHAAQPQSEGQVSRELPAVRASVLREDVSDWFELDSDSPYMLLVADVRKDRRRAMTPTRRRFSASTSSISSRSEIPAVTHVDYSARIQTVHANTNPLFHQLLTRFKEMTGCPVLVNTSFNVRGEPIVCTPEDAFRCFMGNELDLLVVGNCVLRKDEQNPNLKRDYSSVFEPD